MYRQYRVILAVGVFIMNKQGELLIVKKSLDNRIDAGLWTVPGGKVHRREFMIDAIIREVKEEVGLQVAPGKWLGEDVFMNEGEVFHAQHFFCTVGANATVVLEKSLTEYAWIGNGQESKFDFHPNIKRRIASIFKGDYE